MTIFLARHGQTTGDVEDRYGGDYDDHLTELGKQQSSALAEKLIDKGIQAVFASPLARAQETATIIAKQLELTVETATEFKERNGYGVLTGLTKQEALEKYPEQVEIVKDVHKTAEGAEEYQPFQKRIIQALDELGKRSTETVLVVTHGGPIRLIFRDVLKQGEIEIGDCAYTVLESTADGYKLRGQDGISFKE